MNKGEGQMPKVGAAGAFEQRLTVSFFVQQLKP